MGAVGERRRFAVLMILFAIGFGLIGLASAVDSTWPLFLTPLPYAVIPWLVVHADDEADVTKA